MRLSENKTKKIDIRVTPDMYEILKLYSSGCGMSISKYVRLYLEFFCTSLEDGVNYENSARA